MQKYVRLSVCCICYFGSEFAHAQETVTIVAVRLAVFVYQVCWSLLLIKKKPKQKKPRLQNNDNKETLVSVSTVSIAGIHPTKVENLYPPFLR